MKSHIRLLLILIGFFAAFVSSGHPRLPSDKTLELIESGAHGIIDEFNGLIDGGIDAVYDLIKKKGFQRLDKSQCTSRGHCPTFRNNGLLQMTPITKCFAMQAGQVGQCFVCGPSLFRGCGDYPAGYPIYYP